MLSQLGDDNKNKWFDCVPASLAAGLHFLTRRPYTAGAVKDAVYGREYTGGTAARAYIPYCLSQGVVLFPIDKGSGADLVTAARQQVAAGHPTLFTEPDPYMPPNSGFTHVVVAYKFDDNGITVMDPFIAAPVTKTNTQWGNQLQDNEIWGMQIMTGVPTGWTDDGQALKNSRNDKVVRTGFRQFILDSAWPAEDVPLENEHARDPAAQIDPQIGGGTSQTFAFSLLGWTKQRGTFREPVGAYLMRAQTEATALRNTTVVGVPGASTDVSKTLAAQAIQLLQKI